MSKKVSGIGEEMVLVSVIIPIYNLEAYISEALIDLINQSFRDFEVLIVDDGSTDHTVEIVQRWSQKDDRFRLLCQKHENAGVARNRGLSQASGKYVLFLDGDDRFEPELLSALYKRAEETCADIVLFDANAFVNGTNKKKQMDRLHREFLPEQAVFSVQTEADNIYRLTTIPAWSKFFRREFIVENHLTFQSIAKSNDNKFVILALATAKRIAVLDRRLVSYRLDNPDSLQGRVAYEQYAFIDAYIATVLELQKRGMFEVVKKGVIYRYLKGCLYEIEKLKHAESRQKIIEAIQQRLFPVIDLLHQEETIYLEPSDRLKLERYIVENKRAAEHSFSVNLGAYCMLSGEQPRNALVEIAESEELDGLFLIDKPGWYPEVLNGPELVAELERQRQFDVDPSRLMTRVLVEASDDDNAYAACYNMLRAMTKMRRVKVIVCPVVPSRQRSVVPKAETMVSLLKLWMKCQQLLMEYPLTTEQRIQWNHVISSYKDRMCELKRVLSKEETVRLQMLCTAEQYYTYASTIDSGNAVQRAKNEAQKKSRALESRQKEVSVLKKRLKEQQTATNKVKKTLRETNLQLDEVKRSIEYRVGKVILWGPRFAKKLLKRSKQIVCESHHK